jgi:hypothetical protein
VIKEDKMISKNNAHSYEWQMINDLLKKNRIQKTIIVALCTVIVAIVVAFTLF